MYSLRLGLSGCRPVPPLFALRNPDLDRGRIGGVTFARPDAALLHSRLVQGGLLLPGLDGGNAVEHLALQAAGIQPLSAQPRSAEAIEESAGRGSSSRRFVCA